MPAPRQRRVPQRDIFFNPPPLPASLPRQNGRDDADLDHSERRPRRPRQVRACDVVAGGVNSGSGSFLRGRSKMGAATTWVARATAALNDACGSADRSRVQGGVRRHRNHQVAQRGEPSAGTDVSERQCDPWLLADYDVGGTSLCTRTSLPLPTLSRLLLQGGRGCACPSCNPRRHRRRLHRALSRGDGRGVCHRLRAGQRGHHYQRANQSECGHAAS